MSHYLIFRNNYWQTIKISSLNNSCGIINVSRGIIYAGDGSINDIRIAAVNYTKQIRELLWNQVKY